MRIPVIAFLADDNWPGRYWDAEPDARAWVNNFRNELNRTAKFFGWETAGLPLFHAVLRASFASYKDRHAIELLGSRLAVPTGVRQLPVHPDSLPAEPYPLLAPYEHPRTFAGRDAEINRLATLVRFPQLILLLHAPSGVGKSSILLAGLAPHLRSKGYLVSVERAPGDPHLAHRLLNDVLEFPPSTVFRDDDVDLPLEFAGAMARGYALSGKPVVMVLDQLDDVLRNDHTREAALARIGPLLAATAQRLPGIQGFACKWILSYRHEVHGTMREWMEDVLQQARSQKRPGLNALPHDLSDIQKSHDWVLPVMGKPAPGDTTGETSKHAFLTAILRPLELTDAGRRSYPYEIPADHAVRLASVFADARQKQPEAPLVPELQVVLNHLIDRAPRPAEPGAVVQLDVPSDERELAIDISGALSAHLKGALHTSFVGRDQASTKLIRARVLLGLRHLADKSGRRGASLARAAFVQMLDPGGERALEVLSSPSVRLVVERDGLCSLSHDRLAEVVAAYADSEAARRDLDLDQRIVDLRLFVAQRSDLYHRSSDEAALSLTRQQHELIGSAGDALLPDGDHQRWWTACERLRQRRTTRRRRLAAVTLCLAFVVGFLGFTTYENGRRDELRNTLIDRLSNGQSDFRELVRLTRTHDYAWNEIRQPLEVDFVSKINPAVLVSEPWKAADFTPIQLLDVISRGYSLFVPSRSLFGAMSFALEEVSLRNSAMRQRAADLFHTVRTAFIDYHTLHDKTFEAPPLGEIDAVLNQRIVLNGGSFLMGHREDVDVDREGGPHLVHIAAFWIQQHEVTNAEYRRFDPSHSFPSGQEHYPVGNVSWYDAYGYAAWLDASLPTEAQWEYAASGTGGHSPMKQGRLYPWGDQLLSAERAVYNTTGPAVVGSRGALGRSPEGLDDLAGNVWEWCRDWFGPYRGSEDTNPVGPTSLDAALSTKDNPVDPGLLARVLRGGSFDDDGSFLLAARRGRDAPDRRYRSYGFRVVSSAR